MKVAEPNVWKMRAVLVWEEAHGPVPKGYVVHHENRDSLDDRLENLRLLTRADHLREHRPEFEGRRAMAAARSRWGWGAIDADGRSAWDAEFAAWEAS